MFLQTEYNKLEKGQLSPAGSDAHQWSIRAIFKAPTKPPVQGKVFWKSLAHSVSNICEKPILSQAGRGKHGSCHPLATPSMGETVSELQAASLEKMSLSPGMSWAQALDSLSSPPVSCLEGPGQASQEAWLNLPSLQELHILILPWQRCECQSAKPSWGTEAQSQGPRVELGERLPVGLPSTQQASAQT